MATRARTLRVLIAVIAAGLAAPCLPASGSSSPKVRCLSVSGSSSKVVTRPRTCGLHRAGTPIGSPTVLYFSSLKWRNWRGSEAHGSGIGDFGMGDFPPVTLTLSRPVMCAGGRVYSRLSYRLRSGSRTSRMKLATCRR